MGINAIAKKKIGFRNGDTGEILTVSPFEYVTLPDWVVKDPIYKWAVKDGSLELPKSESPKTESKPEKTKVKKEGTTPEGGGEGDKQ